MTDRFGHFSDDGSEYRITCPETPRCWHNYLFNHVYLANLTQHGTGGSFYQPRGEGLRANVTEDRDGNGGPRHVYLRDNATGDFWSLTGLPCAAVVEDWECAVGLGYQRNRSRRNGILADWRMFVPQGDIPAEIWSITVTNEGPSTRTVSVIPYVEMHLTGGSTLMDFIAVLGGRFDPASNAVFGINSCVKFPDYFKAFLASDSPVAAATISREAFVGPYRTLAAPQAVETGTVDNREAGTEWLGASLRHDLTLPAGASMTIHCAIGVCRSVDEGRSLIADLLADGNPEGLFDQLRQANSVMVGRGSVVTGDVDVDRWMNVWLKHQLRFVGAWGRVIGRGYRDILQDTFGHRLTAPDTARACIMETFSKQYVSGKCIRAWRLPNAQLDLQDYSDSPSWMVMALCQYLKETADFDFLAQAVPYLNASDPYAPPVESGAVWEHVLRAQRHLLSDLGQHGLCRIHYGDWCDTMNGVGARGEGESVMLTMQVAWGCGLLAELANRIGDAGVGHEMASAEATLSDTIRRCCWDGEWFIRAFDDDGVAVGSHATAGRDGGEGRIFLNPQSWAIIAGVADPEQTRVCVAAAKAQLDTGYGMILHGPPFSSLRPRIGQMTAMAPGFYENGSVYVHGNCFWIHALAMAGRADEAWEALRAILPTTANKPLADTEPFVIPNYYIGPACQRRMQKNLYLSGWRTGSAAWLYMTMVEWILGARADYDGLHIAPNLPTGWTGARIVRPFRGATYDIRIERPGGVGQAVSAVRVDGELLAGSVIVPVTDGGRHVVEVRVG